MKIYLSEQVIEQSFSSFLSRKLYSTFLLDEKLGAIQNSWWYIRLKGFGKFMKLVKSSLLTILSVGSLANPAHAVTTVKPKPLTELSDKVMPS